MGWFINRSSNHLIYLASPITHPDPFMMKSRTKSATLAARALIAAKHPVVCPAAIVVPLIGAAPDEVWYDYTRRILRQCNELWILPLPGWKDSKGVRNERLYARRHKITIRILLLGQTSTGLASPIQWRKPVASDYE